MAIYEGNFDKNSNDTQPSIFQILGHESLDAVLEPAFKHILKVAAEKKPDLFQKYFQYSDELCCLGRLLLESYFLHRHNGSFSEYFYSIKRISSSQNQTSRKLSRSIILKSLFFLVFFPYVRKKLESWHQKKTDDIYRGNTEASREGKLVMAFLGIYPFLHASLEGSSLILHLLYAARHSKVHSPMLYLSGSHLVRLEDVGHEDAITWKEIFNNGWYFNLRNMRPLALKTLSSFEHIGASAFSISLFFIQFIQRWGGGDDHLNGGRVRMGLPDPGYPKGMLPSDIDQTILALCPLCRKIRTNDTAISVSGFVFCYPCILNHVRVHSSCPVTGYPCKVEHLVKLYYS